MAVWRKYTPELWRDTRKIFMLWKSVLRVLLILLTEVIHTHTHTRSPSHSHAHFYSRMHTSTLARSHLHIKPPPHTLLHRLLTTHIFFQTRFHKTFSHTLAFFHVHSQANSHPLQHTLMYTDRLAKPPAYSPAHSLSHTHILSRIHSCEYNPNAL